MTAVMSLTEWVPVIASIVAISAVVAGIIRDRRKPELDSAQAESVLVNSATVKMQIRKMSEDFNVRRDQRILDIEDWGEKMRSWARQARTTVDTLCDLMQEDRKALGKSMPELHLPEPPPFPPPRA